MGAVQRPGSVGERNGPQSSEEGQKGRLHCRPGLRSPVQVLVTEARGAPVSRHKKNRRPRPQSADAWNMEPFHAPFAGDASRSAGMCRELAPLKRMRSVEDWAYIENEHLFDTQNVAHG